ncbi:hypothetical protein V2G26_019816 [Clonostachys chloroleuca]
MLEACLAHGWVPPFETHYSYSTKCISRDRNVLLRNNPFFIRGPDECKARNIQVGPSVEENAPDLGIAGRSRSIVWEELTEFFFRFRVYYRYGIETMIGFRELSVVVRSSPSTLAQDQLGAR